MNERRTPDVLVEQLALGELSPERKAEVLRALEAEPGGMERLTRIAASNAEILERHPPGRVARGILLRSEPGRRPARTAWLLVPAVAAAVVAVVLVARPVHRATLDGPGPAGPGVTRVKGDPRIVIDRKVDGGTEELERGGPAQAGDLLQLGYVPAGARHGVIVSVDGLGAVTLHLPKAPAESTQLGSGVQRLPFSYELDQAPGFERFILVTSERPIDVAAVLEAVRALGADPERPLALPDGLRQHDFLVRKPGAGGPP